ncbi:MAG: BACON domain-containing protein [Bacteroidales bacterium]|nr:BACON domain-containing protein [Bacteroidales bacterium]
MKRYLCILICFAAAILVGSCQKGWETEIELGVNNTRINIPWAKAQDTYDFVFPVYSNRSWTIKQVAGGDWLTIGKSKGEGREYIPMQTMPNILSTPRAVRVEVSAGKKTIPVYIVISSEALAATEIEDALLDSYLF